MTYMVMVLTGAIMYGTMSSFVKLSYTFGYNAAEISFSQAALAALLLAFYTIGTIKKKQQKTTQKTVVLLLFTGSAIGSTNLLYYQSVYYIPASLSIVILMQFTWFSILLEWILYKVRPSTIELFAVALILAGSAMAGNILSLQRASFSVKGILLSLCSSITYACYIVANGRVGRETRWPLKSTVIMAGSACSIFLINSRTIMQNHHFNNSQFLLFALFLAVVGTTIPTALFAAGIPKVGAGVSAILMTAELPVAVLCANLILHERMNALQITGVIIMLGSISAMNYYKSR